MAKPIIFSVDDDPSVLSSIDRDLRARYAKDYRILPINSGQAALDYIQKLQACDHADAHLHELKKRDAHHVCGNHEAHGESQPPLRNEQFGA